MILATCVVEDVLQFRAIWEHPSILTAFRPTLPSCSVKTSWVPESSFCKHGSMLPLYFCDYGYNSAFLIGHMSISVVKWTVCLVSLCFQNNSFLLLTLLNAGIGMNLCTNCWRGSAPMCFLGSNLFGSDASSFLGRMYSRQAFASLNCENSAVSFVMKCCPISTTLRNPASIQN